MHCSYVSTALLCAVAVPFAYFGAQALGSFACPSCSVFRDVASVLGSDISSKPEVFNIGIVVAGALATAGAVGLFKGLGHFQVHVVLRVAAALSLISFGAGSFWAAAHPLPDPRHDPGALSVGMFMSPFVAVLLALRLPGARSLRVTCSIVLVGFLLVASIHAGTVPMSRVAYEGALQRAGALAMLAPHSILAFWLLKRSGKSRRQLRPNTSLERTREG
jgi:glucan biosynthesis protein C